MSIQYNFYNSLCASGLIKAALSNNHFKLKAQGYMDLSVELQNGSGVNGFPLKLCLTHYFKSNGDLVRDPDLTFLINIEKKIAYPYEFQMDWPPVYNCSINGAHIDTKTAKDIYDFAINWFSNLKEQGHFDDLKNITQ